MEFFGTSLLIVKPITNSLVNGTCRLHLLRVRFMQHSCAILIIRGKTMASFYNLDKKLTEVLVRMKRPEDENLA